MRHALLYQDEDQQWVASVPSLPGCISQGATRAEALQNIAEAMELWIECMRDRGEVIPPEGETFEVVRLNAA
jgi:predicted RNase H-like HicB family nuclease